MNPFFKKRIHVAGIAMVDSLYGEASLLQLAKAYQLATGYHRQHPDLGDL